MRRWYRFGAATFVLTIAAADTHYDWSTADLSYLGDTSEYVQTRAVCAQLMHAEPPASDSPDAAEREALKGCDSGTLYYGIGVRADPVKARKCAILEREQNADQGVNYFVAEGTLMTVYANARGAERNLDVAIHMACQLEDAAAATNGRIKHLLELKRKGWSGNDFSPCEDATSGISGGFCVGNEAALAQQDRRSRIEVITRDWNPQQRTLFERAYRSFTDYAETAHEMDCWRGTLQTVCTISGAEHDVESFLTRIEALSQGKTPLKEQESDDAEGGFNAATDSAGAQALIAELDKDDRKWYEQNARATVITRRKFESNLIEFSRLTFPHLTAHQIRRIFADL